VSSSFSPPLSAKSDVIIGHDTLICA
jgi:hypothetical protein